MEQTQQSVGLQVSQEELWCLLKLMNIPAIPGATVPEDDAQSRDVMAMMYGTAENSLISQDLVRVIPDESQPGGYQRQIDKRAVALIGSGALAKQILTLTYEIPPGIASQARIYFVPGLQVLHMIENGVKHTFIALNDGEMLVSAIGNSLRLRPDTSPVIKGIDIRVNSKALHDAHSLVQADQQEEAIQTLIDSGLIEELALKLVEVLSDSIGIGNIVMTSVADDVSEGFGFLETRSHYWTLIAEDEDYRIRQAILTDITGIAVELIKAMTSS